VGLQGQWSPTIDYVRDLVADGYVGKVLTATLIGCAPNWAATLDRAYQARFRTKAAFTAVLRNDPNFSRGTDGLQTRRWSKPDSNF
jgi:predicted dehydrogenase